MRVSKLWLMMLLTLALGGLLSLAALALDGSSRNTEGPW